MIEPWCTDKFLILDAQLHSTKISFGASGEFDLWLEDRGPADPKLTAPAHILQTIFLTFFKVMSRILVSDSLITVKIRRY